ncbi:MAG: hypothetical protein WDN72_11200 [Alphaproteobacteria bacterium]
MAGGGFSAITKLIAEVYPRYRKQWEATGRPVPTEPELFERILEEGIPLWEESGPLQHGGPPAPRSSACRR